jgi:hypothetical protein
MAKLYAFESIPEAGKTTSIMRLANFFESQGKRVACVQSIKGERDIGLYLKNGMYIYSVPVEAAKSIEYLEKWLPVGYDIYLHEMSMLYKSPIVVARMKTIGKTNEVVPFENIDNWDGYIDSLYGKRVSFRDEIKENVTQQLITKVPKDYAGTITNPHIDTDLNIHNAGVLSSIDVTPKMTFPTSDKEVIAVGAFPAEYWDIFPNTKWYGYDVLSFVNRYKKNDYDLAVIGDWANKSAKFGFMPEKQTMCYKPYLYLRGDVNEFTHNMEITSDKNAILDTIMNKPVGSKFGRDGCLYSSRNNRYWVRQQYQNIDLMTDVGNVTVFNGWVLPQYLIDENILEL